MMRRYIVKQSLNIWRSSHIRSSGPANGSFNFLNHLLNKSLTCSIPASFTNSFYASQSKSLETDFNSLLTNIKLKERHSGKKEVSDIQLEFNPDVEKRLGWKKRIFLQKEVYANSSFGRSMTSQREDDEDGFSEDDIHDDNPGRLPMLNNKIKQNLKESEKLKSHLRTINFDDLSDQILFRVLDDTLSNRLVPDSAILRQLRRYCQSRFAVWNNDNILKVCDWWHLMGKFDDATFEIALKELSGRDDLRLHHLVQVFYFVSLHKDVQKDVVSNFVLQTETVIEDLSMSELTIICEGFLKCRQRIESKLLAEKVLSCIHSIATEQGSEYDLVTLLRFLSRSYKRDHGTLQEVAAELQPSLASINFIAVPHIAAAFAKLRCFHRGLYNAISERCVSCLRDEQKEPMRVKDIWMLLWAFGRVNYSPPDSEDLFEGLVEQLTKNEKSFLRYPMQQIRSLIALCFLDIYPLELINRTFDQTFLKACEDYNFDDIYKQLVILDNSVRIERPEYNGNRLPQEFRRRSLSVPHGTNLFIPEQRSETKFILETLTRVVGGREYLKTSPILPHIRTPGDVQVDLSGDGIPEMSVDEHRLSLPQTFDDSSQRCAILIQLQNNYRLTPRKLLGVHVMKKRQLIRLGYKVAEIPYYEWRPLMQHSEKKRMTYIKRKLKEATRTAITRED